MVDTSIQNTHLIKALQQRLHIIPLEKCPTGENLFQFFDQQWKEIDSISNQILQLRYSFKPEEATTSISSSTTVQLEPTYSSFNPDNPFFIFHSEPKLSALVH